MLNQYKIITITHKNTSLKNIGNYIVSSSDEQELADKLHTLKKDSGVTELMYLATCNRVMYFFTTELAVNDNFIYQFFNKINPSLTHEDLSLIQLHEGEKAIEHLFRVTSSINSLVVGEREILRQLRTAFEKCDEWGLVGHYIRLAAQKAIVAAKSIFSNTKIGEKTVSVVSLAVKKLLDFQLPKQAKILMVGAGQTNFLVGKFLVKYGYTNNVVVFNRSLDKSNLLANLLDGEALLLEDLHRYKGGFDAMIVCTGATEPIVTKELYEKLLNGDTSTKLVIDLSIPNNVSQAATESFNMEYIEIEGLRCLAKENLAAREQEVDTALELLQNHIGEFPTLLQQRRIELAMHDVPKEIKAIKNKAINEVFKKDLDSMDSEMRALIERMMTYMEKKCISVPMKAAKKLVI